MIGRNAQSACKKTGLAATFEVLAKTHNEAAVEVLIAALDDPTAEIRDGALATLLQRRTVSGHREIISRLSTMDAHRRDIVRKNPRYLGRALREAIQSPDRAQCEFACSTVVWLREYDLMPALVNEAESASNPYQSLAAENVLALAELLYQDLATPQRTAGGRDVQLTRQHVLTSLERSVGRFTQHKRREMVEAFLLLAPRENTLLKRIMADPMHAAYVTVADLLIHSQRGGIIRLALSFLDDPQAESSAVALLGQRTDVKFLEHFLRKIGPRPSATISQNLHRIETLAWLQSQINVLGLLEDESQVGAVQLALLSGIQRSSALALVAHLIRTGKPCARRAAAAALSRFRGADANELAIEAAKDSDPLVSSPALASLRSRGIPGALATLLLHLDSPHEAVRAAVRSGLDEFSFDRFQAAFDMLDDRVRRSTGEVVRKVDPTVKSRLVEELNARSRTRRLRAITMADAMNLSAELETPLIERLADEDHLVRAEAAKSLAACSTPTARRALQDALADRSIVVQEAAQESLGQQNINSLVEEAFAAAISAEYENGGPIGAPLPSGLEFPASQEERTR